MNRPVSCGMTVEQARAAGLDMVGDKQIVATASKRCASRVITWLMLEDGEEIVHDQDGVICEWE